MNIPEDKIQEIHEKLKNVKGSDATTITFEIEKHQPSIFLDMLIRQFKDLAKQNRVTLQHKRKIKFRWLANNENEKGFVSKHKVHKSLRQYNRKRKHKDNLLDP